MKSRGAHCIIILLTDFDKFNFSILILKFIFAQTLFGCLDDFWPGFLCASLLKRLVGKNMYSETSSIIMVEEQTAKSMNSKIYLVFPKGQDPSLLLNLTIISFYKSCCNNIWKET